MSLIFNQYYRQYGVRRLQTLLAPRLLQLTSLPRNAIVHYLTNTGIPEIDVTQLYLKGYTKRIMIDFIDALNGQKGAPRRKPVQVKNLVRDWMFQHKQFKYQTEHYKYITDELTLLINNYNYLNQLYRYTELPMTAYNKWWNTQDTLWTHINSIAEQCSRQNFVFINIPDELPGLTFLRIFSTKTTLTTLKIFDNQDKLNLLELWKWINPATRELSVINRLDSKNYGKVNIVFTNKDNNSVLINLGYLNSWIEGNDNATEFSSVVQIKPDQLQKVFLKFMLVAHGTTEIEVVPTDTVINDEADVREQQDIQDESEEYIAEHGTDEEEPVDDTASLAYLTKSKTGNASGKIAEFKELQSTEKDLSSNFADIDEDLKLLDVMSNKKLMDKGIKVDDKGSESEIAEYVDERSLEDIQREALVPLSINESLKSSAALQADIGALSASEYKTLLKDIEKYPSMKDPYGSGRTIEQASVVTEADLALNDEKTTIAPIKTVLDPGMLKSSLLSFSSDYINNVLRKDILSMTAGIQKAGVIIKRHDVEMDISALGTYENHTLELKPIRGNPSVIRFRIPKIEEDSSFVANGNKYLMRLQRVDLPIRKISPNEVALTSYYGKTFVSKGTRKANSSLEWIMRQINLSVFDDSSFIRKVAPANVFNNNIQVPYIYAGLSNYYKSFEAGDNYFMFDYSDRLKLLRFFKYGETIEEIEVDGKVLVGTTKTIQPLLVDDQDQFYIYSNKTFTAIGDIYTLLQLQKKAAPIDFSEVRVFNKAVPVGLYIGYFIGLSGLITLLGVQHQVVETKPRMLKDDEYSLTFKDKTFIFSRSDVVASTVLGGFLIHAKQLKNYTFADFNQKDVYFNLLRDKGLTSIYIREIELTNQLFVDPITEGILKDMGEPLTFIGLLIRSTELLKTYHHPDSQDLSSMRIRGYERISGVIYKELVGSIRQLNNRNIVGRSKLEMSPYKVWQTLLSDNSIKLVEDINPIQNLKETEVVTYVGEGGRNKDSMNKKSRAYHPDDMGVISEATVDSSDVGINAYLSANPNFRNLRGAIKKDKILNITSLLSTSANLAVGAVHDDSKRVNFISIQQGHTVASEGYHQPYVRTGYESVIANRTTDMFAYTAKQDGKVVAKTKTGIIVDYADGTRKGVSIGRIFGKAEGSVYPHDIVSDLEVGDVVKKGDIVAYNTGFFEKDFLNPGKVIMKNSMNVKTALYESNQTHEDGSSISKEVSARLSAKTTKVKSITVGFKQNLLNIVKVGQVVEPKDYLMIIEDEITSTVSNFDEESLLLLSNLSKQAPKAKYSGTIDRIEVLYHGNKEDMSSSLLQLVEKTDKSLADMCKSSGKPVITGQVNDDYRVAGVPLALDKAEIKIYLTISTHSGVGDKGVFANQLKTIFGEVMDYDMHTESGDRIDAIFSNKGIASRIVLSPYIIGTTTTLLRVLAKKMVQVYRG